MTKYPTYKPTNIPWIGEIPEHWEVKRLRHLADIMPSSVDKKSKESEKEVLLCNYVDVYKNNYITNELEFMKATASDSQIEKFLLQNKDVIATKDSEDPNDIAVPAVVKQDFENVVCGYHLTLMRSFGDELDGDYLFWLLYSEFYRSYFATNAKGVTRYGVDTFSFKDLGVVLPSPQEQISIAQFLDDKTAEIDQLIAKKQILIERLQEEKQAIINQAVTKGIDPKAKMKQSGLSWVGKIPEHWEVKKLKYVSDYFKGFAFKSSDFASSGIPIVKASNIKSWEVKNIVSFIDEENQKEEFERVRLFQGDLIVSTVGSKPEVINSAVGQIAVIKNDSHNSYLNQNTVCIRPSKDVDANYLKYTFLSSYFRSNLDSIASWIANQAYMEVEDLRSIHIALPLIEEQRRISKSIEDSITEFELTIDKIQKEITLIQEYKTSLIAEAVTGKIDVRSYKYISYGRIIK